MLTFDAELESGKRIIDLRVGESKVDLEKEYTVAVSECIFMGKDGFTMLQSDSVKLLIEDDYAQLIPNLLDDFFRRLSPSYVMNPKRKEIREKRIAMFNGNEDEKDAAGYIKIAPAIDGRLTVINA
jgi:hypothetical protein